MERPPLVTTAQDSALMQLHQAVWKNDLPTVQKLLAENPTLDINARDRRGNPPIHIAIHFRHFSMVEYLLSKGADPTAKNLAGFVPLHEVVASGNRKMAVTIFLAVSRHFQAEYRKRLPLLLDRIERLPDCYMEFSWCLYSWVPLISRFCPSDVYKIYKRGSNMRVDATLVSFENLHWVRGNISFIFCGSDSGRTGDCVLVDWDKKQIDWVMESTRQLTVEDVVLDVEDLLTWDVGFGKIRVDEMTFSPCRGWWSSEKHEKVGAFDAKMYEFSNAVYHSVSRKSTLSKSKEKESKKKKDTISRSLEQVAGMSMEEKQKRLEELNSRYSLHDYFYGPLPTASPAELHGVVKGEGLLYPSEKIVAKKKEYKGTVWLAPEFPRLLSDLLPIIQQLVPSEKVYTRVRDFIHTQFPDYGFPVKFDLPVFPTISISAHVQKYEELTGERAPAADLFAIPMHFTRVTPQMRWERRKKSQSNLAEAGRTASSQNVASASSSSASLAPYATSNRFHYVPSGTRSSVDTTQPSPRTASNSTPNVARAHPPASAPSVVVLTPVAKNESSSNAKPAASQSRDDVHHRLLADID